MDTIDDLISETYSDEGISKLLEAALKHDVPSRSPVVSEADQKIIGAMIERALAAFCWFGRPMSGGLIALYLDTDEKQWVIDHGLGRVVLPLDDWLIRDFSVFQRLNEMQLWLKEPLSDDKAHTDWLMAATQEVAVITDLITKLIGLIPQKPFGLFFVREEGEDGGVVIGYKDEVTK